MLHDEGWVGISCFSAPLCLENQNIFDSIIRRCTACKICILRVLSTFAVVRERHGLNCINFTHLLINDAWLPIGRGPRHLSHVKRAITRTHFYFYSNSNPLQSRRVKFSWLLVTSNSLQLCRRNNKQTQLLFTLNERANFPWNRGKPTR